ncbi:hypothetical protein [Emticicia agri]|uniref:DUF3037 domain-containing protein n=1 Tax=Emticicia agri TaxID=2492393 RepID=A0A4Q5LWF2_9BACT|nr:hypothetical protein [Emticicia agri]RYU93823.1 hypothetical protein EWM59_20085 [Emticicia agri]
MKAFFSIIYISVNNLSDEKISIGLIMSDNEQLFFKYSKTKLATLKNLFGNEKKAFIKTYLKALEKDISSDSSVKENWINNSYISYLSDYSNNVIQFSPPKNIDIELHIDNFKVFFEKFIFKYEESSDITPIPNIFDKVRKDLYPKIEEKVNIDKIVTPTELENLITPIEVNFIGANGVPVTGQIFDFEKKQYFLENDISRYISLIKALDIKFRKEGKYFVIGKEPKIVENHSLWSQIKNADFLEFVDVTETKIIEEYIDKSGVTPLY